MDLSIKVSREKAVVRKSKRTMYNGIFCLSFLTRKHTIK